MEITKAKIKKISKSLNELEKFRNLTPTEKEYVINDILGKSYLDLRCDWALRYVMKDLNIVKILVEDYLGMSISSINHLPNELSHIRRDDKHIIMDVVCETERGQILVEMQKLPKESFRKRMLYYGASMIQSQLDRGQDYEKLVPVYVICFMDYFLKDSNEGDYPIHHYALTDRATGALYSNDFWICLCELPGFDKKDFDSLPPEERWLYFFNNMANFAGKPEEFGERYSAVVNASSLHQIPEAEQIQYLRAMVSEKEKLDIEKASFFLGEKQGIQKGLQQGEKLTHIKVLSIAKNLLGLGMQVSDIAKATGLPEEEIV